MQRLHVPGAGGAELAVRVTGSPGGGAVLLLPGQSNSHHWWDGLRDRFSPDTQVVTFDYRGTGATTAPDDAWTVASFAADAVTVLDALQLTRVHVYGASMGGRVAQVLAAQHPERVDRLVLAATTPGGKHAVERSREVRLELADPDDERRVRAMVRLFYTPAWGEEASRSHLLGDPAMTRQARARHLRLSARHDAWDLLPAIAAPTLVLHGGDDRLAPVENAHLLAGRIPDARLEVTAGGRHGFFDEFADSVHRSIDRFLAVTPPDAVPAPDRRPR